MQNECDIGANEIVATIGRPVLFRRICDSEQLREVLSIINDLEVQGTYCCRATCELIKFLLCIKVEPFQRDDGSPFLESANETSEGEELCLVHPTIAASILILQHLFL
jgi:hypothetical protein